MIGSTLKPVTTQDVSLQSATLNICKTLTMTIFLIIS